MMWYSMVCGWQAKCTLLVNSPTILYMIRELRHYLAGSNYGSDTSED